jgi:hypothetical protein
MQADFSGLVDQTNVVKNDGQNTCSKCGNSFIPSKFTPYQKTCKDCGRGGKNHPSSKKTVGGQWILTHCNTCGCGIRIKEDSMTAYCNDHCPPEEKLKRKELVQNLIQESIDSISESRVFSDSVTDYKVLNKLLESEIDYYKRQVIDRFRDQDLKQFPISRENIYLWLLAHSYKLSKNGHLFKEYPGKLGIYLVSLVSPDVGFFGFCISYPILEGSSKHKVIRRTSDVVINTNFSKIPDLPNEVISDISLFLEAKIAREK